MSGASNALGAWGERRAAEWYVARGFEVLARNWRAPGQGGELDLVVARHETVVFCEVKTRSSTAFGLPAESVTPVKQARLRRLAAAWLAADGRRWPVVRFDVAALCGAEIEVLEAAF
jgi:putative endonuclease